MASAQNTSLPTGLSQLSSITAFIRERASVKFVDEHPSLSSTLSTAEEDEYMLSGYGDISLSNDTFLPGVLGEISPRRSYFKNDNNASPMKYQSSPLKQGTPLTFAGIDTPSRVSASGFSPLKLGQKGRKSPPPPESPTGFFDEHPISPLLRKILPASPMKARDANMATFVDMVENRSLMFGSNIVQPQGVQSQSSIRAPKPFISLDNVMDSEDEEDAHENLYDLVGGASTDMLYAGTQNVVSVTARPPTALPSWMFEGKE